MPLINILSQTTIDKIAAGEVIERPANVVKELVENALDARATKISIVIEDGGKELIRVTDNGIGMTRADVGLAWKPHTTSKIKESEDLVYVATFGFRGEALSSMAAVAELSVETRHASEDTGTRILISESEEREKGEVSRNPGTTVTVKRLFLHSPVRRKFLANGKNETLKILNMVTRIAFSHPGVGFKVTEGGKDLLYLAEGALKHRAGEIFGFNITNELVPVQWSDGRIHVEGFVSTFQQARARTSHQYFYVNRRSIHSAIISRALTQSYDVLPPGRHPMGVLFFTFPVEEVDVNVHPAKKEVRFLHESRIYWATNQAVKSGLRKIVEAPSLNLSNTASPDGPLAVDREEAPPFSFSPDNTPPSFPRNAWSTLVGESQVQEALFRSSGGKDLPFTRKSEDSPWPELEDREVSKVGFGNFSFSEAQVPYLQLHNSFILFAVQSGLMLVNQQAAHERILYERSLEELGKPGRFSSQQLLFPEIVEFSPGEARFLEEHLRHFQGLAFDLEGFGGSTFQLRGLPAEVSPDKGRKVIYEMVQNLMKPERSTEDFVHRIAKIFARVTGIKMGEPLDYPRVAALIDSLFTTRNPYVSPSGDPVVIRYSLEEILRKFGVKA